jgi:pyruvate dehydrogenase E2 component (dihydrolipoamide acetyltransferase)
MSPGPQAPSRPDGRILATPLARAVASDLGIDLTTVPGTGRGGRIRRADVEAAASRTPAAEAAEAVTSAVVAAPAPAAEAAAAVAAVAPAPGRRAPLLPVGTPAPHPPDGGAPTGRVAAGGRGGEALSTAPTPAPAQAAAAGPGAAVEGAVEAVPLSAMRRTVARRLVESMQSAPHFYLTSTVDAEALLQFREELNRQLQAGSQDLKVSVNDLIVKACAGLLRTNPELNVSFGGDKLLVHKRVHVGIAVALDGGLVVPVLRDADQKSLTQLAREARELAGRARAGRLAASDLTGGTFTVSNLGMFGIDQFTAVINPPEAAILAVGAALAEPVASADGAVVVHRRMRLTLSIDHRALDGATAARFLARLKSVLEHPLQIVA